MKKGLSYVAVLGALLGLAACKDKVASSNTEKRVVPSANRAATEAVPIAAAASAPPRHIGFADPADAKRFYSHPEGSEIFPLAWLLSLHNPETGRPFVEDFERYGLLFPEEKKDDWGLPIGITVHEAKDLGIKMVGVNCAACHVGEIHVGGKRLRIDGAPNQFDIEKFYNELAASVKAALTDRRQLWRLLRADSDAMPLGNKHFDGIAAPLLPQVLEVDKALSDLEAVSREGTAGAELAAEINAIIDEESARFDRDYARLGEPLATALLLDLEDPAPPPPPGPSTKKFGHLDIAKLTRDSLDGSHTRDALIAPKATIAWGWGLRKRVRLLKARVAFLLAVAKKKPTDTAPLHGRVDAFGFARNFLFARTYPPVAPNTAPISYPHLWGFQNIEWLHWNANTNSVMSRNIGQALGVGALVYLEKNKDRYLSSVLVENIHDLERLAYKLQAPKWMDLPGILPKIDDKLLPLGKDVYTKQCAGCHDAATVNDRGLVDYPICKLGETCNGRPAIGTDERHARNFGALLGKSDKVFIGELDALLKGVEERYVALHPHTASQVDEWHGGRDPIVWRAPLGYPARPLAGVWATAPYLHNNSVPTLRHLLLPVAQRPARFLVGDRTYLPADVGYVYEPLPPSTDPNQIFDVTKDGNSNAGHEYFQGSEDERRALLEYLKSL